MVLLVLDNQNLILSTRIQQNFEKKISSYHQKSCKNESDFWGTSSTSVWTVSSLFGFLKRLLLLTQGILVLKSKIYFKDFIIALAEENKCLEIVVKIGKTNYVHCTAFCTA